MQSFSLIFLSSFGFLFLTSTGTSACPANAVVALSQCLESIGSLQGASQEHLCSTAPASISCAQRIIDVCPNDPGINQLLAALNWNFFTQTIETACSGGHVPMGPPANGVDINCPGHYQQQLMVCQQQMNSIGSNPTCNDARSAVGCLQDLMDDCPNKPEVQMISRMLNMDQLQGMVSQSYFIEETTLLGGELNLIVGPDVLKTSVFGFILECSVAPVEPMTIAPEVVEETLPTEATENEGSIETATNEPTETEESQSGGSCSIPNAKRLFNRCKQRIVSSRVGQGSKSFGCRRVLSGLNCIIRIKSTCPKMKVFREYSTIERLQDLRDSIAVDCDEVV